MLMWSIVREQARQAGVDIRAFFTNHITWRTKQLKSLFVERLETVSWLISASLLAYWAVFFYLEPEMFWNTFCFFLAIGTTFSSAAVARWNTWNGRLRYRPTLPTTPTQRNLAALANTRANAALGVAAIADGLFEARHADRDMTTAPSAELEAAARQAAIANRDLATTCQVAAAAALAVNDTSSVMGFHASADQARDALARIMATVPGLQVEGVPVRNLFNQASESANRAGQSAEQAEAREDQRVHVSGYGTRYCVPQVWAVVTMVSLFASSIYVLAYGLGVENRGLVALSYVPWYEAGVVIVVVAEVAAWLWAELVKATEFILTRVSWLSALVPGERLRRVVQNIRVDLFNEERQARTIREIFWSLCFFAPLSFQAISFWIPNTSLAIAVAATTVVGTITAGMFIKRGQSQVVEDNTTKQVGFFYKHGKWITPLVFFLTCSSVEWDSFLNRATGVSPLITIPGKPGPYVVFAVVFLVVMWAAWKAAGKFKGKVEKALKLSAAMCAFGVLVCVVAPIAKAATGQETFKINERKGPEADKPVQMTPAQVSFLPMSNGRQEMVITFYTPRKHVKGVVRFDQQLAETIGTTELNVQTYSEYADCEGQRCLKHEVRVPELKSVPHGSFVVVMRHWFTVEVGARTFI